MTTISSATATSVVSKLPTTLSTMHRTTAPSVTISASPEQNFLSTLFSELGATGTDYLPWVTEVPTYLPSSSSSSDSSSNSRGIPPWAIGLIVMVSVAIVLIAFKIWIKHLIRKHQKRSYQNHLATEPHLTFEEFRERERERAMLFRAQTKHAMRTELRAAFNELGERPEIRRQNAEQRRELRMKVKNWKPYEKWKGKAKETGDIGLMNRNEGEGGRLHSDEESAPPPYSSIAREEN